jgi:hypothetical protein
MHTLEQETTSCWIDWLIDKRPDGATVARFSVSSGPSICFADPNSRAIPERSTPFEDIYAAAVSRVVVKSHSSGSWTRP